MSKRIDIDSTPWLFRPHSEGELDEYFTADHTKEVSETARQIMASMTESRDGLSGKLCYNLIYNQRRYKLMLMKFADTIIRADVTIKQIRSAFIRSEAENHKLKERITELERKMNDEHTSV